MVQSINARRTLVLLPYVQTGEWAWLPIKQIRPVRSATKTKQILQTKRGSCHYDLFPTEATIVAKPTKKSNSAPGGGDLRRQGGVLRPMAVRRVLLGTRWCAAFCRIPMPRSGRGLSGTSRFVTYSGGALKQGLPDPVVFHDPLVFHEALYRCVFATCGEKGDLPLNKPTQDTREY